MNRQKRHAREELSRAVENRDFKQDGAVPQPHRRRAPGRLCHRCGDIETFRAGEFQDFPGTPRAMGHVRINACVLDDADPRETSGEFFKGERKACLGASRQGYGDCLRKRARQQRLLGCARGGSGASASCPALAQIRLLRTTILVAAHRTGNAFS